MQLSKNFSVDELKCPCCNVCNIDAKFLNQLQFLRDHFGKALKINSGYRCVKHNATVGGEDGSYHVKGRAVDIHIGSIDGASKYKLLQCILDLGFSVGISKTFYHVDNRDGVKVTWGY